EICQSIFSSIKQPCCVVDTDKCIIDEVNDDICTPRDQLCVGVDLWENRFEQIEWCRETGITNMLQCVIHQHKHQCVPGGLRRLRKQICIAIQHALRRQADGCVSRLRL